jgi:hypothetical protein
MDQEKSIPDPKSKISLTISQQNIQFKILTSLFYTSLKRLYLCNLTHLQDGNTKVKFM